MLVSYFVSAVYLTFFFLVFYQDWFNFRGNQQTFGPFEALDDAGRQVNTGIDTFSGALSGQVPENHVNQGRFREHNHDESDQDKKFFDCDDPHAVSENSLAHSIEHPDYKKIHQNFPDESFFLDDSDNTGLDPFETPDRVKQVDRLNEKSSHFQTRKNGRTKPEYSSRHKFYRNKTNKNTRVNESGDESSDCEGDTVLPDTKSNRQIENELICDANGIRLKSDTDFSDISSFTDESESSNESSEDEQFKNVKCPNFKPYYVRNLLYELFDTKNIQLFQNSLRFNDISNLIKYVKKYEADEAIHQDSLIITGTVNLYAGEMLICRKGPGEVTHGLCLRKIRKNSTFNFTVKAVSTVVALPIFDTRDHSRAKIHQNYFVSDLCHIAVYLGYEKTVARIFWPKKLERNVQQANIISNVILNRLLLTSDPEIAILLTTIDCHIFSDIKLKSNEVLVMTRHITDTLKICYSIKRNVFNYLNNRENFEPLEVKPINLKKVICFDRQNLENEQSYEMSKKSLSAYSLFITDFLHWTRQFFQLNVKKYGYFSDECVYSDKMNQKILLYSKYGCAPGMTEFLNRNCDFIVVGRRIPADYTIRIRYIGEDLEVQVNGRLFTVTPLKSDLSTDQRTFIYDRNDMLSIVSFIFDLNINLIFSSGGAKGPVHCGVLKYLQMMNFLVCENDLHRFVRNLQISQMKNDVPFVPIESLGGVSIGALCARFHLLGDAAENMKTYCSALTYRNIARTFLYESLSFTSPYDTFLEQILQQPEDKILADSSQNYGINNRTSTRKKNCSWWATCTDTNSNSPVVFCSDCYVKQMAENNNFISGIQVKYFCMKCHSLDELKILRATTSIRQFLKPTELQIRDINFKLIDGAYTLSLPVLFKNSIVIDISGLPSKSLIVGSIMKRDFHESFSYAGKIVKQIDKMPKIRPFQKKNKAVIYLKIEVNHFCLNFTEGFDDLVTTGFDHGRKRLKYFGGQSRRWSL